MSGSPSVEDPLVVVVVVVVVALDFATRSHRPLALDAVRPSMDG